MNSYPPRLSAALTILSKAGLTPPIMYRWLWQSGIFVRPPQFASYLANLFAAAIGFGGIWAVILTLLSSVLAKPFWSLILTSIQAGLLFGVVMATYYVINSRIHSIPKWEELECFPCNNDPA